MPPGPVVKAICRLSKTLTMEYGDFRDSTAKSESSKTSWKMARKCPTTTLNDCWKT
jgi:hypothetical protein|tara:strand:+ start:362 stop:529 length:168 start_codon:yes stop_codon:yes gene_type:complete